MILFISWYVFWCLPSLVYSWWNQLIWSCSQFLAISIDFNTYRVNVQLAPYHYNIFSKFLPSFLPCVWRVHSTVYPVLVLLTVEHLRRFQSFLKLYDKKVRSLLCLRLGKILTCVHIAGLGTTWQPLIYQSWLLALLGGGGGGGFYLELHCISWTVSGMGSGLVIYQGLWPGLSENCLWNDHVSGSFWFHIIKLLFWLICCFWWFSLLLSRTLLYYICICRICICIWNCQWTVFKPNDKAYIV